MKPACEHCNDTGSLTKDLHGFLNCVHCTVADARVSLEIWAREHAPTVDAVDAWILFDRGYRQGMEDAADICEAMNDSSGDAAAYDQREQNSYELERESAISACVTAIRAKRGGNDG